MAQRGRGKQQLLSVFVLFLVLAVFFGYVAAKHFFEPYLLQEDGEELNSLEGAGQQQALQSGTDSRVDGERIVESGTDPVEESDTNPAEENGKKPAEENAADVPQGSGGEPAAEEKAPPIAESGAPEAAENAAPNDEGPEETTAQTAPAEDALVTMYCVQFGSFLEEGGAKDTLDSLQAKGIDAYIIQKQGAYKVLGAPFGTKEEARQTRDSLQTLAGQDLFVTTMEVKLQ